MPRRSSRSITRKSGPRVVRKKADQKQLLQDKTVSAADVPKNKYAWKKPDSYAIRVRKFWSFVEPVFKPTKCWNWTGSSGRYGHFRFGGRLVHANRVSWIINFGSIPKGMKVLHKCDNGLCVNPNHLFLGTQRENILDCIRKGRANRPRGELQHLSKLTPVLVKRIRAIYSRGGVGYISLGRLFGINGASCRSVIKQKTWKHVK